ncbi:MAG: 2-hydroxyacyl-CoA dehydratase family protein [Oscillospiraceae bacterium]
MTDLTDQENALLEGKISLPEFIYKEISLEKRAENPEAAWFSELQQALWQPLLDAKKNGKKVIFFGGSVPLELIYAFDCVPFFLDLIPLYLSSHPELVGQLSNLAEKDGGTNLCSLGKIELGAALLKSLGTSPDAFIYAPVPCNSYSIIYDNLANMLAVPCFKFDMPSHRGQGSSAYVAMQVESMIEFLEQLCGEKLNWERVKPFMENSNLSYEMLTKCLELRKISPCPLSGRLLAVNELITAMAPDPKFSEFLQKELSLGTERAKAGQGACKNEKYRVLLLQNSLWSVSEVMDWLEEKYGAITIMGEFAYKDSLRFENPDDREDSIRTMALKAQNLPALHGAAGSSAHILDTVGEIIGGFKPNVSIFLGHVGCRHTWASSKMLTDMIYDDFGLTTLYVDIDSFDGRYKSCDDIKYAIGEYMETVVIK